MRLETRVSKKWSTKAIKQPAKQKHEGKSKRSKEKEAPKPERVEAGTNEKTKGHEARLKRGTEILREKEKEN